MHMFFLDNKNAEHAEHTEVFSCLVVAIMSQLVNFFFGW